jgi:regulator of replication initiation timing
VKALQADLDGERKKVQELDGKVSTLTHSANDLQSQVSNLSQSNQELVLENEKLKLELT